MNLECKISNQNGITKLDINLRNITSDPIHLPAGDRISDSLFDLNIVDLSDDCKHI